MLDKRQMVLRLGYVNLEKAFTVIGGLCAGLPNPKEWAQWVEKGQPGPDRDSTIYEEILGGIILLSSSSESAVRTVWEPTLQSMGKQFFPRLDSSELANWTMDEFGNIGAQSNEYERFFVLPLIDNQQEYFVFSYFYSAQKTNSVLQELRNSSAIVKIAFCTSIQNFSKSKEEWLSIDEAVDL